MTISEQPKKCYETLKGLRHSEQLVVEHKDTAAVYGSGALEVFATPAMIALMEKTCLMGVCDKIGEGNTTVGIAVNINLHQIRVLFGRVIAIEVEVFCATPLQLLNCATRNQFHLRLGCREIEEITAVCQRRTADADMNLLGAVAV